jgi:hypothetical protein
LGEERATSGIFVVEEVTNIRERPENPARLYHQGSYWPGDLISDRERA